MNLNNKPIEMLEKLSADKLSLLYSLKSIKQNAVISLDSEEIDEICCLISEAEKIIKEIDCIDLQFKEITMNLDYSVLKEIKAIYALLDITEGKTIFENSKLPTVYEKLYNYFLNQKNLLIELNKQNTDLQKKAETKILLIKQSLKNIKKQKHLNTKYLIYENIANK